MPRVILGVTGSVAAVRTPALDAQLREAGHEVRIIATKPATHFFHYDELADPSLLFLDEDEWPAKFYERDDPVLHIEFRNWADLLVVAPLDANTLGKFALGLCDNFLTCVFRAWDFRKPVILAPAMNTLMWESPVTRRHFQLLLADHGQGCTTREIELDRVDELFSARAPGFIVIPPQSKRLACGDVGTGAMAEVVTIANAVQQWVLQAPRHGEETS